jgi:ADP-heptose:LPS heptosyltransferase
MVAALPDPSSVNHLKHRESAASETTEMISSRETVLIFHAGPLGDFVFTWPLVAGLAKPASQRRVVYVTHEDNGRLVQQVLGVDWTKISPVEDRRWPQAATLCQHLVELLPSVQTVYNFHTWGEALVQIRAAFPAARWVEANPSPLPDLNHHYCVHMAGRLSDVPEIQEATRRVLESLAHKGLGRIAPRRDLVVLHPGSSGPVKAWPTQKFVAVAERLSQTGSTVRALLGPRDLEWMAAADVERLGAVAELCRPQSLVELWQQISSAAFFLGHDSGPTHLAGIIGVPAFALFGPTDPVIWGPLGPRVHVMRAPLSSLAVDDVLGWICQFSPELAIS